jgi:hypothetical protein
MRLYLTQASTGQWLRFTGTQDDAKASKRDAAPGATWKEVEVGTTKEPLLDWLNNALANGAAPVPKIDTSRLDLPAPGLPLEAEDANPHPDESKPQLPPVEDQASPALARAMGAVQDLRVALGDAEADVAEAIGKLTGARFAHVMEAVMARMGELGEEGWSHFRAVLKSPCYQASEKLPGGGGIHQVERGLRFVALSQLRDLQGDER